MVKKSQPIKVAYVDDLTPFQEVLGDAVVREPDIDFVINQSCKNTDVVALVQENQPDVLVWGPPETDFLRRRWGHNLPDTIRGLQDMKTEVIVVSEYGCMNKEYVPLIVNSGVRGYLMREEEKFVQLLWRVVRNIHHDKTYTYYSDVIRQILAG